MKNKALRIVLVAAVALTLLVICLLAGVKLGERILFTRFYFNGSTEFKVPGVSDGFIQQGFDYLDAEPLVYGNLRTAMPFSANLEDSVLITPEGVEEKARYLLTGIC